MHFAACPKPASRWPQVPGFGALESHESPCPQTDVSCSRHHPKPKPTRRGPGAVSTGQGHELSLK